MVEKRILIINGQDYHLDVSRKCAMPPDLPRLVVVSYQPNSTTTELVRVCLDSIRKYTHEPHELWVVDNCSPENNIQWLLGYPELNVVLNHNKYVNNGSYDNGVALEIAKAVIDPESRYLMTLHMDTMVCKEQWLTYLLSKFDKEFRAAGVRMDRARTPEGVLHILGAMFDFQLIRHLELSFMPELPAYDVGDLVTVGLRKAGFKIFACDNTFTNPDAAAKMLQTSIFRDLFCDRAFNDQGEVFFLHLGRGFVKSAGGYKDKRKETPEQWIAFARNVILADSYVPNRLPYSFVSPKFSDLSYSLRRYYVDEFYDRNMWRLPESATVLDIGGKKEKKRGQFNIEKHPVIVRYANIDASTNPDYLCDASKVPVEDNSFDAVICAEVLEHVRDPSGVLREAFRVLKPGGLVLICVPFLFRIHPDPDDFGRYTDQYWSILLGEIGFKEIIIEKQGTYPSVLADMLRAGVNEMQKDRKPKSRIIRRFLPRFIAYGTRKSLELEQKRYFKNHSVFNSFTTGYGIVAAKPPRD